MVSRFAKVISISTANRVNQISRLVRFFDDGDHAYLLQEFDDFLYVLTVPEILVALRESRISHRNVNRVLIVIAIA